MNTTNFNINIDIDTNNIIDFYIKVTTEIKTNYFTDSTGDAILRFNSSVDDKEKNIIFNTEIYPVFYKLATTTCGMYHNNSYNINKESLVYEIITHLFLSMDKWDNSKGKAFSYFNMVAKNYARSIFKTSIKQAKIQVPIIEIDDTDDNYENHIDINNQILAIQPAELEESIFHINIINYIERKLKEKSLFYRNNQDVLLVLSKMLSEDFECIHRGELHRALKEKTNASDRKIGYVLSELKRDLIDDNVYRNKKVTRKPKRPMDKAYFLEYRKKHKTEAKAYRKDYYKNHIKNSHSLS